jgi:hypothetical protein
MHEELEIFERNKVWELVDPPPGCKPIGTKWVWKNKHGEKGEVVRNKSERGNRLRGDLCSCSSFGGDLDPSSLFRG